MGSRSDVHFVLQYAIIAGPGTRAVKGVGLRPLACWSWGFDFRQGYGCLSVVSVVCCQVEVSATGLITRPDCGMSECYRETRQ